MAGKKIAILLCLLFFAGFVFGDDDTFTRTTGTPTIVPGSLDHDDLNLGDDYSPWQASIQTGVQSKTLTESSATSFVLVAVASDSFVGGKIEYTIDADDATDFQARSGEFIFTAVNKAGTVRCSLARPQGSTTVDNTTDVCASSKGATHTCVSGESDALTNTFTCADSTSNGLLLKANAVSSLTQTTLAIQYRVVITSGTPTVTPQ